MNPSTSGTAADPPERDVIGLFAIDLAAAGRRRSEVEAALAPGELADLAAVDRAALDVTLKASRRRRLVARACLRRILGQSCGIHPRILPLVRGANGKPRLATVMPVLPSGRLTFNASHSGDLLVVAVAVGLEIGVDVELILPLADPLLIAVPHFSEAELRDLCSLGEPERSRAFYAGWTRKEAFLKATGRGLAGDFRSFDVSLRPGEPARIKRFRGSWAAECPDAWRLHVFEPTPGTCAALAVRSQEARCRWRDTSGIEGVLGGGSAPH